MSEIRVSGLSHIYSRGTPFEHAALKNVDLTIPHGQLVGIAGRTGSGKSSLIQHFNALLQPTEGQVFVDGKDINADKASRRAVRFQVGLVFQYPEYQLFEETVFQDIAFGPKNMGLQEQEVDERVREAAGFAGVSDELFDKSPLELSGGQKRRIAIAGVIAMRPGVLILDEPTAGLDPAGSSRILTNICQYRESTGSTVLIVSHNMDDLARISDRLIVLADGCIAMDGTPAEVFADPEKLEQLGLAVPKATEITLALKRKGIMITDPVYTHDQLKTAILKAKEAGKC